MNRCIPMCLAMISLVASGVVRAETGANIRKSADAAVDRNILSPTAETIGAGELTINDYELFVTGLTYGLSDDLQLSASTVLPILEGTPMVALVNAKWRLFAGDRLIFSLQPGVNAQVLDDGDGVVGTAGLTVLLDYLVTTDGDLVLTLAESTQFFFAETDLVSGVGDGVGLGFAAGLNWRVGSGVKLMAEVTLPAFASWTSEGQDLFVVEEAMLVNYGVRFFGENVAVDLSFLRSVYGDSYTPLGTPFLTLNGRF